MTTPSLRSRVLLVDVLKATAAQFIVWHHLVWYGMADITLKSRAAASAVDWLVNYGRYAVAVFIATGGFLAAQFLPMRGLPPGESPLCLIRDRYLRLIGPFVAALLLAVACHQLAYRWVGPNELLGDPPSLWQFFAHVLMLQGLLGVESLSAGVWYVAIDFQLYALFVLLLWLGQAIGRRLTGTDFSSWLSAGLVLAMALASLLVFNRDARWDETGFYFFGSYALGIASGWAIRSGQRARFRALILCAGVLALWVEFRARIAVATMVALLLGFGRLHLVRWEVRFVHYLGANSFALFLVHFPIYLLVVAAFHARGLTTPRWEVAGLAIAWLASMVTADLFHRYIELPLLHWQKRRFLCRTKRNAAAAGASGSPTPRAN